MTTDKNQAFEEWWNTPEEAPPKYADSPHKRAAYIAWHAAVAWATAREREWQPIATAPKDGTPVLCFTPDDEFNPDTGIDVLWWDDDDWLYAGKPVVFQPTHWMPLPVAPLSSTAVYYKERRGDDDPC